MMNTGFTLSEIVALWVAVLLFLVYILLKSRGML